MACRNKYQTLRKRLSVKRTSSFPSLHSLPADARPCYTADSYADSISSYVRRMMLNQLFEQMDSSEQIGGPAVLQDQDHSEALPVGDGDDDGDVMSSGDENNDENPEEERVEKLETTVTILVSGRPFQVYKQRLLEWLNPPLTAHASRQNGIPQDPVFALSLPLLVDKFLENLAFAMVEPRVSTGKVRVYWTPVRSSIQSARHHTNAYIRIVSVCSMTTLS